MLKSGFHERLSKIRDGDVLIEPFLKFALCFALAAFCLWLEKQWNPFATVLDTITTEFIRDLNLSLLSIVCAILRLHWLSLFRGTGR
ncbi:hypothetical protein SAMN06264855_13010 [Halorubrum vacuolatum]|uniref:Uncharacterized protein n=1 Tax=Halorubrum vacuolatum TaxID=63740 RepID=A0A238Y536_HALVU|nr:hypothetical protein SAMN06264855_13010 [Halorubrum vacuolatum]